VGQAAKANDQERNGCKRQFETCSHDILLFPPIPADNPGNGCFIGIGAQVARRVVKRGVQGG